MSTISEIRQKILELAMQGNIVTQNEDDEHASILFEKIKEEKQRLIEQKVIKKQPSFPSVEPSETPYSLPEGWIWVRLGEIGDWGSGSTPKRSNPKYYDGNILWLKTGELNDGYISDSEEKITDLALSESSLRLNKPGDVLIAMYGATIGKLGILEVEATTNQACCACTPFSQVSNKFLFYYLKSMREQFRQQGEGGAQPNISKEKIVNTIFPLPPFEEQLLIVEKVEELFSICEEWENEVEFQQKHIENLREKVLEDAVSGLIVPQDENDESATILLENIKVAKEQLIKDKQLKKSKPLPPVEEKEKLFGLPSSWKWVKLGEISKVIHYGYTASATEKDTGVRMVRITDIQDEKVNWETVPFCEIEEGSVEKYQLAHNDVLIARTGGTVGKSFLVDNAKYVSVFASYLIRIQLFDDVNAGYVKRFLESKLYWDQIKKQAKGTGQPNVNATGLSNLVLPLPPKEEQDRIVEKVDDVWESINEIENRMVLAR